MGAGGGGGRRRVRVAGLASSGPKKKGYRRHSKPHRICCLPRVPLPGFRLSTTLPDSVDYAILSWCNVIAQRTSVAP